MQTKVFKLHHVNQPNYKDKKNSQQTKKQKNNGWQKKRKMPSKCLKERIQLDFQLISKC